MFSKDQMILLADKSRSWPLPELYESGVALTKYWSRISGEIEKALKNCVYSRIKTSTWSELSHALAGYFGYHTNKNHCFNVEPERAYTLLERQVTSGLAHHLQCPKLEHRKARVEAFLKTVFHFQPTSESAEDLCANTALAEDGRIDLLVKAKTKHGKIIGALIEAKFGHKLTRDQLPGYRKHAKRKHELDEAGCARLVLATQRTGSDEVILRKNKDWLWVSWDDFMRSFERNLGYRDCDDEAFRRFRRTIWHRAAL
jgi:PD-(D/E)XK nuclease superfamily